MIWFPPVQHQWRVWSPIVIVFLFIWFWVYAELGHEASLMGRFVSAALGCLVLVAPCGLVRWFFWRRILEGSKLTFDGNRLTVARPAGSKSVISQGDVPEIREICLVRGPTRQEWSRAAAWTTVDVKWRDRWADDTEFMKTYVVSDEEYSTLVDFLAEACVRLGVNFSARSWAE